MNVRDWLYVTDHASALWAVLTNGALGDVYNIGGDNEVANIEVVRRVLSLLEKPESLIRYVKDRLGHDRRYAMNSSHLQRTVGWKPAHSFETGLELTVQWYLEHESWWRPCLADAYQAAHGYLAAGTSKTTR
jgi:dTDP-glucose 4,6-dehydratase